MRIISHEAPDVWYERVDAKRINFPRNQVERSLIHPQYANRFLRRYVI